ncbi:major facilitator superfamily domain-containing protein [Sordaria brevicollis]|uniref:Major facilitator superfamily domain-containing protein n=1 Tax=Sordaria brevicollis TaxID=83679 RepID=A0AAE0NWI4_SORBR|nr:major facilitator superfamily domain-containing protein [Sordaria brevicollis]
MNSTFPRRSPGADIGVDTEAGSGRTLDGPALNPTVLPTIDHQTITKQPPTASPSSETTSAMPETAASRKAQGVPLLGGHDGNNSRSSDASIDSLTPLTPGVAAPSYHATTSPENENSFTTTDIDTTTGKYALRSWLTILGAWLAIFSSFGLLTALSICQNYISEDKQLSDISDGTFAWVFSLYFVVSLGLGMYVGPLSDRFGARSLVLSGTVFLGVGMVVLACRSETWAILLAFGLLSGLTSTFLFIPSLVTIHQFFGRSPRYYTFATSLATTAGPTAGIVFPYATRNLSHEVSWPWTIRTLGLICFFLAVIANFLIRSPPSVSRRRSPAPSLPASPTLPSAKRPPTLLPPGSSASSASSASANSTTPIISKPSTNTTPSSAPLKTSKSSSIHPSLTPFLSSSSYTLLFLSLLLVHLSIYTTTTYLSAFSLFSQGYSHSYTFRTTTLVVNISSIGGRLLAGLLGSGFPFLCSSPSSKLGELLKGLGPFNTTTLFSLLATLSLLATWLPPVLHPGLVGMSSSHFTAFAVLFGLSSGAVLGLEPVLVSLVLPSASPSSSHETGPGTGDQEKDYNGFGFGQAFGTLYTLVSMSSIAGIPIGSHLVKACGRMYWGLVVFVGVAFGVGMFGLLVVRWRLVSAQGAKSTKGKAVVVVVAGDERIEGVRGFEWTRLSLRDRNAWRELAGSGRARRSWQVWGVERV